MTDRFSRSLVYRTALMLGAVVLLALVSIVTSVVVADRLEGDAEAINVAGSLRMQAYRIALLMDGPPAAMDDAIADFERRLASPPLARAITDDEDAPLNIAWRQLAARWSVDMKPALAGNAASHPAYRERLDGFVAETDRFVRALQQASEQKVTSLRIVQGISMFLTLALVFGVMFSLHADVIAPLYALVGAARATGRGDFSIRVEHVSDDELGVLGQAFNTMADDLSGLYGELEDRVRNKTVELQRNNDALAMLYRVSQKLSTPGNLQARLPAVLGMIEATLGLRPALFLTDMQEAADFRVITPDGEFPSAACLPAHTVAGTGRNRVQPARVHVFPVSVHQRAIGQLFIESEQVPDAWIEQVLRSAAEVISTAMSLADAEEDQRRILLMQERAVIARELHDSLAQSLSYLKIQVSRIDTLLSRDADRAEIRLILDDLRDGLNSAYRQLRELLTTFRLRIDAGGLDVALAATVEEFRSRGLDVQLDSRLQHCPLTASEEIHVLHTLREALANVARHAHASHARVLLRQRADGAIEATVEDDGVGMPPHPGKRQHHGLVIMRERAATLGGQIEWQPVAPHGTRVLLAFRPSFLDH